MKTMIAAVFREWEAHQGCFILKNIKDEFTEWCDALILASIVLKGLV